MTKTERRENRTLWESRVAEFEASGQSVSTWCAAKDLKIHQLRYWLRKFKSEHRIEKKQKMQWISVEVGDLGADKPQEALPVHVGKAMIEVRPGFNPELLSHVVKTLSLL